MRTRALVAALTVVVGLTAVAAAFGAGPAIRDHNTITDEDANFCGTGELVLIQGTEDVTLWLGTTGGDPTQAVKAVIKRRITYTNPDNGLSVVEHWAFSTTNEIVSGLESGVHTHEFVERGLKATFKPPHGGLLTRDAGSLTYPSRSTKMTRKLTSKSSPFVGHTQPSKKTFSARHSYRHSASTDREAIERPNHRVGPLSSSRSAERRGRNSR
jgi:hypothetical protein